MNVNVECHKGTNKIDEGISNRREISISNVRTSQRCLARELHRKDLQNRCAGRVIVRPPIDVLLQEHASEDDLVAKRVVFFVKVLKPQTAAVDIIRRKRSKWHVHVVCSTSPLDLERVVPESGIARASLRQTADAANCSITSQVVLDHGIRVVDKVNELVPVLGRQAKTLKVRSNHCVRRLISVPESLKVALAGYTRRKLKLSEAN